MKFKVLYSVLGLTFAATLFMGNSTGPMNNGNGDRSGASGPNCTECHGSSNAFTTLALFDSNGAAVTGGYQPGTTYQVRISMGGAPISGNNGFHLRARNSTNSADLGTFTAMGNYRAINGLVEHTQLLAADVHNISWTAPAAGSGAVTFYGSSVLSNADGTSSGDHATPGTTLNVAESTTPISVNEQAAEAAPKAYLFPTRAESDVNVRFTAVHEMDYTIEVLSLMGQVLSSQTVRVGSGEQTQTLNVGDLAQGVYYLRLRTAHSVEAVLPFQK